MGECVLRGGQERGVDGGGVEAGEGRGDGVVGGTVYDLCVGGGGGGLRCGLAHGRYGGCGGCGAVIEFHLYALGLCLGLGGGVAL